MRVLRFELPSPDEPIEVPLGSVPVSVGLRFYRKTNGSPYYDAKINVWMACQDDEGLVLRDFRVVMTGDRVPNDAKYVGTAHVEDPDRYFNNGAPFAAHVFEVVA